MTNKEANEILKPLFEQCKGTNGCIGYIEHYFTKHEEMALDLAIKALEERPQGEWIIVKDEKYGDNVKCPFCGKELAGTDLNFCCKCGADMKGGAE